MEYLCHSFCFCAQNTLSTSAVIFNLLFCLFAQFYISRNTTQVGISILSLFRDSEIILFGSRITQVKLCARTGMQRERQTAECNAIALLIGTTPEFIGRLFSSLITVLSLFQVLAHANGAICKLVDGVQAEFGHSWVYRVHSKGLRTILAGYQC